MKTTKLVAFGLISMIGLGLAAQTSQAAEITTPVGDVTGKVEFTTDDNVYLEPPLLTDKIQKPNPSSSAESTNGNAAILYATNFEFGVRQYDFSQIDNLFATSQKYTTQAEEGQTGTELTDTLGVSIFNTGDVAAWTLTAQASEFKEDTTGNTIPGMYMTISNVKNRQVLAGGTSAVTAEGTGTYELKYDNAATPAAPVEVLVAKYANTDNQTAVTNFAFGTVHDVAEGEEATYFNAVGESISTGVSLFIPASANISEGDAYTADITWTLSSDSI